MLINVLLVLALVVGVAAVVNPEVRAKLQEIGQQVSRFVAQLITQIKEKTASQSETAAQDQPDAQTASSSGAGQNESFLDVLVRGAANLWAGLGWGN
jgi:predicted PurR-regulated permease PerM